MGKIKLELLELTSTNIKFTINSNVSFANALRRILLGETPIVAIDYIEVEENTSIFPDEMLANRLGFLPLENKNNLKDKNNCTCENYCDDCALVLILNKTNKTSENINVLGKDLIIEGSGRPASLLNNTFICKLAPNQTLKIKCIARKGLVKNGSITHAKYCPVSAVSFYYDKNNAKKHTNLWTENQETIKETWPFINEDSTEFDYSKVDRITMNVEIVEGVGKPKDILYKALSIYKEKMIQILNE